MASVSITDGVAGACAHAVPVLALSARLCGVGARCGLSLLPGLCGEEHKQCAPWSASCAHPPCVSQRAATLCPGSTGLSAPHRLADACRHGNCGRSPPCSGPGAAGGPGGGCPGPRGTRVRACASHMPSTCAANRTSALSHLQSPVWSRTGSGGCSGAAGTGRCCCEQPRSGSVVRVTAVRVTVQEPPKHQLL